MYFTSGGFVYYRCCRGTLSKWQKVGCNIHCVLGAYHSRLYELFQGKGIVDFVLMYSIFVGIIFVIWIVFVMRMYRDLND